MHKTVEIDCSRIKSMNDFHAVFKEALGFPDFYGNNMDAWIDCMTSIDEPDHGMSNVHAEKGQFLILSLKNVNDMIAACPMAYEALVDGVAFVNYRRMEVSEQPVLGLAYYADPNR